MEPETTIPAEAPAEAAAEAAADTTSALAPVHHDFLREDLNKLRDTVNALVEAVNNL